MASSGKSASLVVMLMLAALVASAQATDTRSVWVKNTLPNQIKCNGVQILPGVELSIKLKVDVLLVVDVLGLDGKWVRGQCNVPKDVAKLAVVVDVNGKAVVVKVVAVLGGLIHQLLKTLLGTILVTIKVAISL